MKNLCGNVGNGGRNAGILGGNAGNRDANTESRIEIEKTK